MARNNLAVALFHVGKPEVALRELDKLALHEEALIGIRWTARRNRAIINLKLNNEQDCLQDLHLIQELKGAGSEFTEPLQVILRIVTTPQSQRKHHELAILESTAAIRLNGAVNLIVI